MLPNRTPILVEVGIVHVLETIRPDQLLLIDFVKVLYALLCDGLLGLTFRNVFVVLVHEPSDLLFWSPKRYL